MSSSVWNYRLEGYFFILGQKWRAVGARSGLLGRMGRNLTEPNVQEVHCDVSYMWSGIVIQLQYSSLQQTAL